jgi:hypothetical protein
VFNQLCTTQLRHIGSGGIAPPFLISALDGGETSASHLSRFTPCEKDRSTHCIGGWISPRAGLDIVECVKLGINVGLHMFHFYN